MGNSSKAKAIAEKIQGILEMLESPDVPLSQVKERLLQIQKGETMQPEPPKSSYFTDLVEYQNLLNALMDAMYTNAGPRNREEANLCNWFNYEMEGDKYKPLDLSLFESDAI